MTIIWSCVRICKCNKDASFAVNINDLHGTSVDYLVNTITKRVIKSLNVCVSEIKCIKVHTKRLVMVHISPR